MAETLPNNFPTPSETAIASYNFVDVEEGTGLVQFYLGGNKDDSGYTYKLSRNSWEPDEARRASDETTSGRWTIASASGTGSAQNVLELNFDTSVFNFTTILRGTATLSLPVVMSNAAGAGSKTLYIVATLYDVDSVGTETSIATETTTTKSAISGLDLQTWFSIDISVSKYLLAVGHKVRLELVFWLLSNSGVTAAIGFGHDPTNSEMAAGSNPSGTAVQRCTLAAGRTQSTLLLPYKVEI